MTEDAWFTITRPHRMLKHVESTANERRLRLLIVACHRWSFPFSGLEMQAAVSAVERYADGIVTEEDVAAVADFPPFERFHRGPTKPITISDLRRALPTHWRNEAERGAQCDLIRDIFGNPFHPVHFSSEWRTDTAVSLARTMYDAREFSAMPILADALQDAGCDDETILAHCRDTKQVHVRGCWVVDLVLGKK